MTGESAQEPTFAEVFERLRISCGLSQAQLAKALGVWDGNVARWRKGGGIEIENVWKIADYFGVDRNDLARLAHYDDNSLSTAEDRDQTISPAIAALVDADHKEMQEQLQGIPQIFWPIILTAQRAARRLAVDNARVSLQLSRESGVSNPTDGELETPRPPERRRGRDRRRGTGPEHGTLPSLFPCAVPA